MWQFFKSDLLWQLVGGFALGAGMMLLGHIGSIMGMRL